MSVGSPPRVTPQDLLSHPDRKNYELVNGELVELNVSAESSWIAGRIHRFVGNVAEPAELGWAYPEGTGFQCFVDDRQRVRKPDTSFVSRERQPHAPPPQGFLRVAPDLVVEVISPRDLAWEVEVKVQEWLEAGVSVVWVVMPHTRTVTIYQPGRDPHIVAAREEVTLPELLPSFACRVEEFFPRG